MPGAEQHPRLPVVIAVAAYGAFVRGDLDAAIRLAEKSVATADRLGTDSSGLAERALANAFFYEGDIKTGLEWMDRMLESARTTGSPARLAHALYMRSVAATSVGDTPLGATLAPRPAIAAERSRLPTAIARPRVRGGRRARRRRARARRHVAPEVGRPRQAGRQPLARGVRAHGSALARRPQGQPGAGARGLRVGGRHLVPGRRLGEPVAVAPARVRHLRPARREPIGRGVVRLARRRRGRRRAALRAVRRRAAGEPRRRSASRSSGRPSSPKPSARARQPATPPSCASCRTRSAASPRSMPADATPVSRIRPPSTCQSGNAEPGPSQPGSRPYFWVMAGR